MSKDEVWIVRVIDAIYWVTDPEVQRLAWLQVEDLSKEEAIGRERANVD